MGGDAAMPDASAIGLQEARCRRAECRSLLARVRLDGRSQVEIKCRLCESISTFASEAVTVRLKPDGQGGFVTVPVADN